jgi:hypothetical protein
LFATVLLGASGAQAQEGSAGPDSIQIRSCLVSAAADKTYDCKAEATKAVELCNGTPQCEVQIGYNLTSGKDIDPGSGYFGKQVTITYMCGETPQQRGPYYQDDHASLVLECNALWW